jgi:hypothetical protein
LVLSSATNAFTFNDTLGVDTTNQRVGVGNTAPGVALDVTGAGRFSTGLTVTTGNITSGSGAQWLPNVDSTTALAIAQASGVRFVDFDTTNSRVGIGTTAPAYTLDVNGNLRVGTTLYLPSLAVSYALYTDGSGFVTTSTPTTGSDGYHTTTSGGVLYPTTTTHTYG